MMHKKLYHINKHLRYILVFTILCIIFISLSPIITWTISSDSSDFYKYATPGVRAYADSHDSIVNLKISMNMETMSESDNPMVSEVLSVVSTLYGLLWITLVVIIITYVGFFSNVNKLFTISSKKIVLMSFFVFLFYLSVLIFFVKLFLTIGSFNNVDLTSLFSVDFPVKYFFVVFGVCVYSFVLSINIARQVFSDFYIKKVEVVEDKIVKQNVSAEVPDFLKQKELDRSIDKDISAPVMADVDLDDFKERDEIDNFLKEKDKPVFRQVENEDIDKEIKNSFSKPVSQEVFKKSDEVEDKIVSNNADEDVKQSDDFENALFSAIDKKKKERKK